MNSSQTSSVRLASTVLAAFAFVSCSSPESTTESITPAAPVTMTSFVSVQTGQPDADWSPDGRWISYADTRDRKARDIWIRPVDGGDAIQVTDDPADDRVARWSPDGDRLLFRSDRGGSVNLWTISPIEGKETLFQVTADADSVDGVLFNWSPDGSEIVYSSSLGEGYDVRVIPATGGVSRQIVETPGHDWDPDWSPDGEWIAYNSCPLGKFEQANLWVVAAAGGTPRQLTTDSAGDFNPNWSPDGQWIAFTSTPVEYGIAVVPAAGGTAIQISDPDYINMRPRWSPDGQRLVFTSIPQVGEILAVPAGGGQPVRIAENVGPPRLLTHLTWSPDGQWVAFVQSGSEGLDIWKAPVSGGDPIPVTHGGYLAEHWATGLSWSPDGKTIAFNSDRSGQREVWTVAAEGGEPDRITSVGETYNMEYSPDGQTIAFTALAQEYPTIWSVPSSGGAAERLLDLTRDSWSPSWSPDGTRLAFTSNAQADGTTGMANVWILSLDSGEISVLTRGRWPDWSDDDEIAFERDDALWTMPASGGTATRVAGIEEGFRSGRPQWSPDGKQIRFVKRGNGVIRIADIGGMLK